MYKILFVVSLFVLSACSPTKNNVMRSESSALQAESSSGIIINADVDTFESTGSDVTVVYTVKSNSTALQTQNVTLTDGSQGFSLLTSVCSNFSKLRTCTVRVKFTAAGKANGQYQDQLVISDLNVPLTANLNKPSSDPNLVGTIEVSDGTSAVSSIDLGMVALTGSVTKSLVLKDLAKSMKEALTITTSNPEFKLLTSVCAATTLNSSSGCSIRLQFIGSGLAAGEHTANLKVGTKLIPLSATVQSVVVAGSPSIQIINDSLAEISSHDFGTVSASQKASLNVKIKNSGTGSSLSSVQLSGSAFYITGSTCGSVLSSGAICSLVVNVNSALSGVQTGSLAFGGKTLALSATLSSVVAPITYSLTLNQPANGVLSANKLTFNAGESAVINLSFDTAIYQLSAWTGDCAAIAVGQQCSLTMDSNKTVSATLSLKPVPSLTMGNLAQTLSGNLIGVGGQATNIPVGTEVSVSVNSIPYIFAIPPVIRQVSTLTVYSFQIATSGLPIGTNSIRASAGGATVSKNVEIIEAPEINVEPINDEQIIFVTGGYTSQDIVIKGQVLKGGTVGQEITLNYYGNLIVRNLDSDKKFEITIPQGSPGGCCGTPNSFYVTMQVGSSTVQTSVPVTFYTLPELSLVFNYGNNSFYLNPDETEPVDVSMNVYGDFSYTPNLELMVGSKIYRGEDIETVSETSFKVRIPRSDLNALPLENFTISMTEKRSSQIITTNIELKKYPEMSLNVPSEITLGETLVIAGSTGNTGSSELLQLIINGLPGETQTENLDGSFSFNIPISSSNYFAGQNLNISVVHLSSQASATANVTVIEPVLLKAVDKRVPYEVVGYSSTYGFNNQAVSASWLTGIGKTGTKTTGTFTVPAGIIYYSPTLYIESTGTVAGSLTVTYSVYQGSTNILSGTTNSYSIGSSSGITIFANLVPGTYSIDITGNYTIFQAGTMTTIASIQTFVGQSSARSFTSFLSYGFNSGNNTPLGNIFTGDILTTANDTFQITGKNGVPTSVSRSLPDFFQWVQGKYGEFGVNGRGDYIYHINGVESSSMTDKDSFTYTIFDSNGGSSTATVSIDASMTFAVGLASTKYIIESWAYPAKITLGTSLDTFRYRLLANDDLGGNGLVTWTNFSVAEGDKVDFSSLLIGWSGSSATIANFISVQYVGGNTEVYIDRDGVSGQQYSPKKIMVIIGNQLSPEQLLGN